MTGSESYPKPQIALVPTQDNSYSTPCMGVCAPSHGYTPSCPPSYEQSAMCPAALCMSAGGSATEVLVSASPALVAELQSLKQALAPYTTQTQVESRSFDELQIAVKLWAANKGLLDGQDPTRQILKAMSELGEFADEVLKGNEEAAEMELGDVYVTLILAGDILGTTPRMALGKAYDKIAKRTGKTVDGVFIKD